VKTWGSICLLCVILFLVSAGCQAVQKQGAEPEVVAQGTVSCDIENFTESPPLLIQSDPELGTVQRGYVIKHHNRCGVPYLDGAYIGIQDEWHLGNTGGWSTMMEIATDEGGIWKGTHEVNNDLLLKGSYFGDSKYKGLHLALEYDLAKNSMTYTVTRVNEQ
jgi:hypothetical protein